MEDVVIVSAARTPVGAFNGAFANVPAHRLGEIVIRAALERAKVTGEEISEVILGQVLTAAQGQNPPRQASIAAGIPIGTPAWGVNMVCGSGLRTVALGAQAIQAGDSKIVVAGGQESMSLAPHAAHLRAGQKFGDMSFIDTMIRDGLWDAFNGYHMGMTAENLAESHQITRGQQDELARTSHQRAARAWVKLLGEPRLGVVERLDGEDGEGRHGKYTLPRGPAGATASGFVRCHFRSPCANWSVCSATRRRAAPSSISTLVSSTGTERVRASATRPSMTPA